MEQTKNKEIEIDLKDLWIVFKHCWLWVLAVLVVVFTGIYVVMSVIHVPEYTATAKIYVLNIKTEGGAGPNNITTSDISIANYLINDCQELLMSEDNILSPVIKELGLQDELTPKHLRAMISHKTSSVSDRTLLLSVTSTDKEESQRIANSLAFHMTEYFNNDLYNQELLNVTDSAKLPESESNAISHLKIALIAFVCALLVYFVFFIVYIMDDKINTAEDVELHLGISTLGTIPNEYDIKRRKNKNGYYYSQYGNGSANPAAEKLAKDKQPSPSHSGSTAQLNRTVAEKSGTIREAKTTTNTPRTTIPATKASVSKPSNTALNAKSAASTPTANPAASAPRPSSSTKPAASATRSADQLNPLVKKPTTSIENTAIPKKAASNQAPTNTFTGK